jgi:hypothetical protein
MELQVDREFLDEIKGKIVEDLEMQEVMMILQRGKQRDNKVALGLCDESDRLLIYEGLIWIPNNNQL